MLLDVNIVVSVPCRLARSDEACDDVSCVGRLVASRVSNASVRAELLLGLIALSISELAVSAGVGPESPAAAT